MNRGRRFEKVFEDRHDYRSFVDILKDASDQGKASLTIDGEEHFLEQGTCFLIPPDVAHPARVVGDENWVAVAAYCDECPVLKKALDKEDPCYPLPTDNK